MADDDKSRQLPVESTFVVIGTDRDRKTGALRATCSQG
jgi:hypothetical protein